MKLYSIPTLALALVFTACSAGSVEDEASPPSTLDINSAKRTCRNTAEMAMLGSGVPEEAIQRICDCSIDKLVETGDFTKSGAIPDEKMNAAMEGCLDNLEADLVKPEVDI
ncbi:MAG: hypothetical protein AAGB23_07655 [Pseudomonadota bacterium]